MAIPKAGRRHPLAVLSLHLAVVGALATVTAQAPLPPPHPQLLTPAAGRTVPTTTVITVAAITLFITGAGFPKANPRAPSDSEPEMASGKSCWRNPKTPAEERAEFHLDLRPKIATKGEAVVASQLRGCGRRRTVARVRQAARRRGLDPTALAALPVVPYAEIRKHRSSGGGGEVVLECAVCLAAFGDGDELRLLPHCSHAFHPDCIDPWLEGHVTCPLCRANLEKPTPPPPLPQTMPQAAVAVLVEAEENDDDEEERKQEAAELEKLRCSRRAAWMLPRSRSSVSTAAVAVAAAADTTGGQRFTVRLPPHVREEVLRSRRLRHATSPVITLGGGGASGCAGSSSTAACAAGGERCHGVRRRWAASLLSTQPCGHVVCSLAARWPGRCKAKNLA
ncbi:unnamed protein product [Urochloa decumbens]|uniref:RING-type E3 ubiquitin transferase n=1 Tax=Urochloa decumbens TaxID=240449 RepID=A0ABC9EJ87_9POAL